MANLQAEKWKDAVLLMRIPFSLFLMPVYWFALANAGPINVERAIVVFLVLHLFMYPASNGYNSYFDRDKGSIGGLKRPPKVGRRLFWLVMVFDACAVGFAFLAGIQFAVMVFVYTLVSKAYSYEKIRLKKFPVTSTLVVTLFQGGFTYIMVLSGLGFNVLELSPAHWMFAAVATLLLVGSYPLTQVYQHGEDRQRGDRTISLVLGVRGTFLLSLAAFLLGLGALIWIYFLQERTAAMVAASLGLLPVCVYFLWWMGRCWKDVSCAGFGESMRMNALSSLMLSLVFILQLVFGL